MNITYRSSEENDAEQIDELLKTCFGDRAKYGALNNLEGRYVLAFDNGKCIAMTGLSDKSDFNGYGIDWTCVSPEYRGIGLITNMLRECIENCHNKIYCSCWRMPDSDGVNLYHAMNELGFTLLIKDYKTYDAKHMLACRDCIHYLSDDCRCHEDLYVRY